MANFNMTLSQALRREKKLKGQIKEALDRAEAALVHREDQPPAFNFQSQLERAEAARSELIAIETARRNRSAATSLDYAGRSLTLTEAVVVLQELRSRIAWLRGLPCRAHAEQVEETVEWDGENNKRLKVTHKFLCALPEQKRAEMVDALQTEFDNLNNLVEVIDHKTPL